MKESEFSTCRDKAKTFSDPRRQVRVAVEGPLGRRAGPALPCAPNEDTVQELKRSDSVLGMIARGKGIRCGRDHALRFQMCGGQGSETRDTWPFPRGEAYTAPGAITRSRRDG